MLEEWKIDNGHIRHLHTGEPDGEMVKVHDRYICGSCKSPVPTLVRSMAETKVEKEIGLETNETTVVANEKQKVSRKSRPRTDESTKLTLEEITQALAENPDLKAKLGIGTAQVPVSNLNSLPEYEIIPATMIFFKGGRPDNEVRDFLKSRGYTFRQANVNGENRPTWVGPSATLKGTLFDKE